MAKNQVSFFATKADLESLLQAVESERPLQWMVAGLFDSPNVEPRESLLGNPNLGSTTIGDPNHTADYLVFARGISIEVRAVPQRRGGIKYAVDLLANPKTIASSLGEHSAKRA